MLRDMIGTGLVVAIIVLALSIGLDAMGMIDIVSVGKSIMSADWSVLGALGII